LNFNSLKIELLKKIYIRLKYINIGRYMRI